MARAIGILFLGVNLSTLDNQVDEAEFLNSNGIETIYSPNSGEEYAGIEIARLDEAKNLNWSELVKGKNKVSAAQKEGSDERIELAVKFNLVMASGDISEELKKFLAETKPEIHLVWSES